MDIMERGNIYIYTSRYPFDQYAESFLSLEIETLFQAGWSITLVPISKTDYKRQIPDNVQLDLQLAEIGFHKRLLSVLRIIYILKHTTFRRIINIIKKGYIRNALKYLYAAGLVYEDINNRANTKKRAIFYSYWLSYAPIAFALYKKTHPSSIHKYIARGHGSDVYTSEIGVYCPLRLFTFNKIDAVFTISQYGKVFLTNKYPILSGKIYLSRLGVKDNYVPKTFSQDIIRIVSCSSVIPLKRVALIYRSIYRYASENPNRRFEWSHYGDGQLMASLKGEVEKTKTQLTNLSVLLYGAKSNNEILKSYRDRYYHCFVLLSTTEGIPVSIMEAISSGIPVIATDVGGVKEIVNEQTGVRLELDFTQEDFDTALDKVLNNGVKLSKSAHDFYLQNYNAETNYRDFSSMIERLL